MIMAITLIKMLNAWSYNCNIVKESKKDTIINGTSITEKMEIKLIHFNAASTQRYVSSA
jgi:hypothetical protein